MSVKIKFDDFESSWLTNRSPYIVLFGAVSLVVLVVLGQFIFGKKLLLFNDIGSDTFYAYYAIYYFLTNYLSAFHLPLWSFNISTGSCVLIYFPFLYDPFSIIYFLGGVENLSRMLVWVFVLKIFFAAAFTYIYLCYLGIANYASLAASVLFSFNGFLMCWGQHYQFSSWVIFLPLLLFSIEIWLKNNKWLPMVFCISFMALKIVSFVQVSIFCFLYFLFRLVIERDKFLKHQLGNRIIKFCSIFLLGMGISAVLWLPEYYILKSSPRISADFYQSLLNTIFNFFNFNTHDYYISLLSRIFSNNLQGIGSEYTGFLNYYEAIQIYAGILPLLLLPQLYIVFSAKTKWLSSIAFIMITIFLVTPGFSQIMNGFQYPSYRWGYNIIMFELLLSAIVLNEMLKKEKISVNILLATGIFLFLCLTYQNIHNYNENPTINQCNTIKTFEIIAFIIAYSFLLYKLITGKRKNITFLLIIITICTELIIENYDTFNQRSLFSKGIEYDKNVNYFDYGKMGIEKIKENDPTIYRIEKNHWILSLNDSLVQDYYGLDSYYSLNNPSYLLFLKYFDYKSRHLNIIKWNSLDYPYLADILSVKYHLTKNTNNLPSNVAYKKKYGDVFIYLRKNSLPFGFTYESYIPKTMFKHLSKLDKERALLQGAVVEESPSINLTAVEEILPYKDELFLRNKLKKDVLNVIEMTGDKLTGNINLKSDKLLFLSIPFDKGWSAYVNDKKVEILKVNLGFMGLYLKRGDNRVELKYVPPYMTTGIIITLLSILIVIITILSKNKIDNSDHTIH